MKRSKIMLTSKSIGEALDHCYKFCESHDTAKEYCANNGLKFSSFINIKRRIFLDQEACDYYDEYKAQMLMCQNLSISKLEYCKKHNLDILKAREIMVHLNYISLIKKLGRLHELDNIKMLLKIKSTTKSGKKRGRKKEKQLADFIDKSKEGKFDACVSFNLNDQITYDKKEDIKENEPDSFNESHAVEDSVVNINDIPEHSLDTQMLHHPLDSFATCDKSFLLKPPNALFYQFSEFSIDEERNYTNKLELTISNGVKVSVDEKLSNRDLIKIIDLLRSL